MYTYFKKVIYVSTLDMYLLYQIKFNIPPCNLHSPHQILLVHNLTQVLLIIKLEDTPLSTFIDIFPIIANGICYSQHDLKKVAIQKMSIAPGPVLCKKNNLLESITFVVSVICNSVESK